jgi:hypothetical protein
LPPARRQYPRSPSSQAPAPPPVPGLLRPLATTTMSRPRLSALVAARVIAARESARANPATAVPRASAPSARTTATGMERARPLTSSPTTFPTTQTLALPRSSSLPLIARMTAMSAREPRTRVRSTTTPGMPPARRAASAILATADRTARRRSARRVTMSWRATAVPRDAPAVDVGLATMPQACASATPVSTATAASL